VKDELKEKNTMSKALRIMLIVIGILVAAGGLVLLVSGEGEPQRLPETPHSARAYS
jgi:flagellar basal body-associated protein FliL